MQVLPSALTGEQIGQIRRDLAAVRETGGARWEPYFLALLADVYAQEGQVEVGLGALAEALAAAQATGERWAEAELYRLRRSLLLQQTETPQAEAETWLQRAWDVARRQEARALELRAAMSLSRLWHQQGTWKEARDLLAEVSAWLTEGFDTADLQETKALLEELASRRRHVPARARRTLTAAGGQGAWRRSALARRVYS
jgi:predicted ATPase